MNDLDRIAALLVHRLTTDPATADSSIAASSASSIPARFRPDPEPTSRGVSLVASLTDNTVAADDTAAVVYEAWRTVCERPTLGQPPTSSTATRIPVLTIRVDHPHRFSDEGESNRDVWRQLADQARADAAASRGALVADGGYCAPGQPVYQFFQPGPDGGLLTLPVVGVERGRVIMPVSPSIQDVFDTPLWDAATGEEITAADDASGTVEKPCYFVPCPDPQTWGVSAFPYCLTFGNFSARAWPEMVSEYIAVTLRAMRHKLNATLIAELVAAAQPAGPYASTGSPSTIAGLVALLGFYGAVYRDRHRLEPTAILDVVLPSWIPEAYAADKLRRSSTVDYSAGIVQLNDALRSRGLRPQYVHDWQTISDAVAFPQTADALIFEPGTAVRLDGGTLDLGVVRDSTLNAANNFSVFVEPFAGLAVPGHEVMLAIDLPTCPTGTTGASDGDFECEGS